MLCIMCGDVQIIRKYSNKKTKFVGRLQGLQAYQAHTIESALALTVKNEWHIIDAPQHFSKTYGFVMAWGGQKLHSWICHWMKTWELPKLMKGQHAKVFTLLSDPMVAAELQEYMCGPWIQKNLQPSWQTNLYLQWLINICATLLTMKCLMVWRNIWSMNCSQRYILKLGGVSLCRKQADGCTMKVSSISHTKGSLFWWTRLWWCCHLSPKHIYYNFQELWAKTHPSCSGWCWDIASCATRKLCWASVGTHGSQWDDISSKWCNWKSWVMGDKHCLRKKGVGWELHMSSCISSTSSWLDKASEILEYGKSMVVSELESFLSSR